MELVKDITPQCQLLKLQQHVEVLADVFGDMLAERHMIQQIIDDAKKYAYLRNLQVY